jgi:hypothetical protein
MKGIGRMGKSGTDYDKEPRDLAFDLIKLFIRGLTFPRFMLRKAYI